MMNRNLVKLSVNQDVREKFNEICVYAGNHQIDVYKMIFSKCEDLFERAITIELYEVENFVGAIDFGRSFKGPLTIVIDLENNIETWDQMERDIVKRCSLNKKEVMDGFLIRAIITLYWQIYKETKNSNNSFETVCKKIAKTIQEGLIAYTALNYNDRSSRAIRQYISDQTLNSIRLIMDLYQKEDKK